MRSLKQHIRNWLFPEEANSAQAQRHHNILTSPPTDSDDESGLNIRVRSAVGGRIVSFRHYDSKLDRSFCKTYIVPEDQDFERELGRMITLESLR